MFGPLFQLYWFGTLCPCLEKEHDQNARVAMQFINQAGRMILWFPTGNNNNNKKGFSLGGFWGGTQQSTPPAEGCADQVVQARLVARDSDDALNIPEILVDPESNNNMGYKLNIALRRVERVQTDPKTGHISLLAKAAHNTTTAAAPKELVRFMAMKTTELPLADEERNLLVHHLLVLVEWWRQKRDKEGWDDDVAEDDEDQPNFLQARANKAAHFAKREIELQQVKRNREERKAKLIAQSGGLKYTALAMASRTDE